MANDGKVGSSRSMYTALKHTHLPVDIVIEEDSVAGRLSYYDALYVTVRQCIKQDINIVEKLDQVTSSYWIPNPIFISKRATWVEKAC